MTISTIQITLIGGHNSALSFFELSTTLDGSQIKLKIILTPTNEQEFTRHLPKSFKKIFGEADHQIILLCCDLTDNNSFNILQSRYDICLQKWQEIKYSNEKMPLFVLVGMNTVLESKCISDEQIERFCTTNNISFQFFTSTTFNYTLATSFYLLCKLCLGPSLEEYQEIISNYLMQQLDRSWFSLPLLCEKRFALNQFLTEVSDCNSITAAKDLISRIRMKIIGHRISDNFYSYWNFIQGEKFFFPRAQPTSFQDFKYWFNDDNSLNMKAFCDQQESSLERGRGVSPVKFAS